MSYPDPKSPFRKHFVSLVVQYFKFATVFLIVAAACVLIGEQGVSQKQKLEDKLTVLQKENELIAAENQALETKVTLLRTDPKTIESVAKRKLGMARPDETVFLFDKNAEANLRHDSERGLGK